MIIDDLGGRKFTLVCLIFIASVILMLVDRISSELLSSIVHVIIIAYLSGNVLQTFLQKVSEEISPDASPVIEQDPLRSRKFKLVVLIYLVALILIAIGELKADTYASIVYWVVGGYVAGNVTDKFVSNGFSFVFGKKTV